MKKLYFSYWQRKIYGIVLLLILLPLVIIFSVHLGSVQIPFITIWKVLVAKLNFLNIGSSFSEETIVTDIRLPRALMACLVGIGLATAGAAYQGLFRNPLADPYILGIAQGAGLGAIIGFVLHSGFIPCFSFAGGILAVTLVYLIAKIHRALSQTTLILAGVAIGALLSAISSFLIINLNPEEVHGILGWLMGSFSLAEWKEVIIIFPFIIFGLFIIWIYTWRLNVLQLDEEQALQLGVNVERVKLVLLISATLLTASSVCFCGTIGFVGIIIPHTVRLIWGYDYRILLPLSALTGGIFLVLVDMLVRVLSLRIAGEVLPIGVITAILGAPFFLYLLRKQRSFSYF
jgi:iron complex transport system permease protein